jgi:hypothetical protein
LTRVKKRSLLARFRIDTENVIGLPGITRLAAKRQILQLVAAR